MPPPKDRLQQVPPHSEQFGSKPLAAQTLQGCTVSPSSSPRPAHLSRLHPIGHLLRPNQMRDVPLQYWTTNDKLSTAMALLAVARTILTSNIPSLTSCHHVAISFLSLHACFRLAVQVSSGTVPFLLPREWDTKDSTAQKGHGSPFRPGPCSTHGGKRSDILAKASFDRPSPRRTRSDGQKKIPGPGTRTSWELVAGSRLSR